MNPEDFDLPPDERPDDARDASGNAAFGAAEDADAADDASADDTEAAFHDDNLQDGDLGPDEEPMRTPGERWMHAARPFALPALLFVGVLVLIVRARVALEQTPRFLVDPTLVSVVARPAWVSDQVARGIALSVATGLGRQASLLDGRQLQQWADALTDPRGEISPWIESVERLEPRFPSQADVRIRMRHPVMIVDGELLVAASGHVLGPGPVAVSPSPLAYAGRHLDEDYKECAAAAGELELFRAELEREGVRMVTVGIGADGTVVFTTDAGVEVSWGRSARKSPWSHLDLPAADRLGNLRQVLVNHPGLNGLRAVQLWTDRPVTVLRGA